MSALDNPAAFPSQPLGQDGLPTNERDAGMTLRDWFAGQALTGQLAYPKALHDGHAAAAHLFAADAYALADAMLAARGAS